MRTPRYRGASARSGGVSAVISAACRTAGPGRGRGPERFGPRRRRLSLHLKHGPSGAKPGRSRGTGTLRDSFSGPQIMSGILVYEEDDLMRALIHEWLREAGYRVRALPARDAQPREAVDLVIASISSPRDAGAQRVREIKVTYPDTPPDRASGSVSIRLLGRGRHAGGPRPATDHRKPPLPGPAVR